jgi:hypothetical protein
MARVYLSLPYLRGHRFRSGYFQRIGRLSGLESLPLEHHVREAGRIAGKHRDLVIRALVEMVDPRDRTRTRVVNLEELSTDLALESNELRALEPTLDFLADPARAVVRRVGAQHWRLDHDYLTAAVHALYQRQGALARRLSEASEEFRSSRRLARWRTLLGPREWFQITWEWLHRRLIIGQHRGYFALSGLRWFAPLILLAGIITAPVLLQQNINGTDNKALELLLDLNPRSVWQLYDLPGYARLHVVDESLSNDAYAKAFLQGFDMVSVLLRFDPDLRRSALTDVERRCSNADNSPTVRNVCVLLYGELGSDFQKALSFDSQLGQWLSYDPTVGAFLRTPPSVAEATFESIVEKATPPFWTFDQLSALAKIVPQKALPGLLTRAVDALSKTPTPRAPITVAEGMEYIPPQDRERMTRVVTALASVTSDWETISRLMNVPLFDDIAWKIASNRSSVPDRFWSAHLPRGDRKSSCEVVSLTLPPDRRQHLNVLMAKRFLELGDLECALSEAFAGAASVEALTAPERRRLAQFACTVPDSAIWSVQHSAGLVVRELSETEAADLFSQIARLRVAPPKQVQVGLGHPSFLPAVAYSGSNASLYYLALRLNGPLASEKRRSLGPACQGPLADICGVLDSDGKRRSEIVRDAFVYGTTEQIDAAAVVEDIDTSFALQILKASLDEFAGRAQGYAAQVDAEALRLLRKRLSPEAEKEFAAKVHADWTEQHYTETNFPSGNAAYWMAVLSPEDIALARQLFVSAVRGSRRPSAWIRILRDLDVPPRARAKIALDNLVDGLDFPTEAEDALQFVIPGAEDIAWDRFGWVNLKWTDRLALAHRLCEIHNCPIDVRDRWAFAQWARKTGGHDLSKPPKTRPTFSGTVTR